MDVRELEEKLKSLTHEYLANVNFLEKDSKKTATQGELYDLGKQTYYTIDACVEEILKRLKEVN